MCLGTFRTTVWREYAPLCSQTLKSKSVQLISNNKLRFYDGPCVSSLIYNDPYITLWIHTRGENERESVPECSVSCTIHWAITGDPWIKSKDTLIQRDTVHTAICVLPSDWSVVGGNKCRGAIDRCHIAEPALGKVTLKYTEDDEDDEATGKLLSAGATDAHSHNTVWRHTSSLFNVFREHCVHNKMWTTPHAVHCSWCIITNCWHRTLMSQCVFWVLVPKRANWWFWTPTDWSLCISAWCENLSADSW